MPRMRGGPSSRGTVRGALAPPAPKPTVTATMPATISAAATTRTSVRASLELSATPHLHVPPCSMCLVSDPLGCHRAREIHVQAYARGGAESRAASEGFLTSQLLD